MTLFERVRAFLKDDKDKLKKEVPDEKILNSFDDIEAHSTGAFFDEENTSIMFNSTTKKDLAETQKNKIMLYRKIAKNEDVSDAIDEIVNEIVYSEDEEVIKIQINEDNEKIKDAVKSAGKKILRLLDMNKNAYNVVRQSYIDGQIIIHCQYDKDARKGIQKLKMIEPIYFYFDEETKTYKYLNVNDKFFYDSQIKKEIEYQKEEIVRNTYGLAEGKINLSYLDYAIKPSNRLKTLEDLLIPLRFSRSISRRVFNVDTGELSNSQSLEAMREMQKKFKYKKFYNTETGEVTNQQHITSMVEDYWFANRSGGRGTQVDVLDETGNLGEINDILYFQKKLYKSLHIPQNRIPNNNDADRTFDYDSTQVTKEDMKFFMFIQRIRKVYIDVIHELLKRELVSTKVMSIQDYNAYKENISIRFANESLFLEKLKLANFTSKLDVYSNVQDYAGKLFPIETVLKTIFRWTDEEIEENFDKIQKESKMSKYAEFYKKEDY